MLNTVGNIMTVKWEVDYFFKRERGFYKDHSTIHVICEIVEAVKMAQNGNHNSWKVAHAGNTGYKERFQPRGSSELLEIFFKTLWTIWWSWWKFTWKIILYSMALMKALTSRNWPVEQPKVPYFIRSCGLWLTIAYSDWSCSLDNICQTRSWDEWGNRCMSTHSASQNLKQSLSCWQHKK